MCPSSFFRSQRVEEGRAMLPDLLPVALRTPVEEGDPPRAAAPEYGVGGVDPERLLPCGWQERFVEEDLPEEGDRFGGTQLSEGKDGLLPHPEFLVVEQSDQIGNHGRVADPSEDEAQVPYEIPVGVVELPPDSGDGFRVEPRGERTPG